MNNFANHHVKVLTEDEQEHMIKNAAGHYQKFLEALNINTEEDHNTNGTANRVAKMFVKELCAGRFTAEPAITEFKNASQYEDLILVGPLPIKSMCSHHMMPIVGSAYIAVLPHKEGTVLGLSKYARVAEHFARRPQIQEELTRQICDYLVEKTKARGIGVLIRAEHFCMSHRGVGAESTMQTTALHGELFEDTVKREFLQFVSQNAGSSFKAY